MDKIETRNPNNLLPLKQRKQTLTKYVSQHTVEHLKNVYKIFYNKTINTSKNELVKIIVELLSFAGEQQFRDWFFNLPELMRIVLYEGTFTDYVIIPNLERKHDVSLAEKMTVYSWRTEWKFKPELNFDFLQIGSNFGCPITVIPRYLQDILSIWLVPPAYADLSKCRQADQSESWDNSRLIADTFPLLYDALTLIMEGMGEQPPDRVVRNGFKKKEINELRSSTGIPPFNMENEYAPSSVDIAARFILCMCNFKCKRPNDGQEEVRKLVQAFFGEKTQYPKSWDFTDMAYLEFNVCLDHLNRPSGYYIQNEDALPLSRKVFQEILLYVARDGSWFDADSLAEHIRITRKDFRFCGNHLEGRLKVKAESFVFDGLSLTSGYDDFHPEGILYFYLMVRPLFKAYCHIFAALGILEITQVKPLLVKISRSKHHPFSVYDSLKAIRITEFGRWCLGISNKSPPKPSREYQAIADRELLLVTVQGNSMERRLYLDKIGQRLGEDRWRISPASFITGCINKRQIAERIDRFKLLIDPEPAPHWEQLFKKVIDRAGLFDSRRTDILIYDLPEDRELLEELLRDPEIKRIVRRVEGRMLAIIAKDQPKFHALLSEHGIAHF